MTFSKKNKIFVFFLEYWPIPFGVLQTCCKIQKYKKIIFCCVREIHTKTYFQNFKYLFFYKRKFKKDVRVLTACNKQKHFLYIFSLSKTQTLHLITIKVKKSYINQILKALINQLLNPKNNI